MTRRQKQKGHETDRTAQSNQGITTGEVETHSDPSELQLLEIVPIELTERVEQTVEARRRKSAEKAIAEEIAAQSDFLTYSYRLSLRIKASSTEELQEVQEAVGIDERTIRELQDEAGLQRLHPSRRKQFIKQILQDRIEDRAAAQVDEDQIRADAEQEIAQLFDGEEQKVRFTWIQRTSGSFRKHHRKHDDEEPDMVTTIRNATTDLSETVLQQHAVDVVVLTDGADVTVESPIGTQSLTLDRGGYKVRPRSIRTLAQEAGLIETETRNATCQSSDKEALDIEINESNNTARVIELKSSDGGYSKRYTKAWTEYRDFDAEREMVLITVGQASYYRNSFRGKQERTWVVGRDDGQTWTHQVYNSHTTVDEALDFMRPAEVKRLEAKGRQVIRQGDVYFVEMIRRSNFEAIEETRHSVVQKSGDTVVITHPEHDDLELSGTWKAVPNNDGSQS